MNIKYKYILYTMNLSKQSSKENTYKNYITKHENFSYILTIIINEELCENEKNIIISTIYNFINDKIIVKNISGNNIPITWRISNEKDLLHYYTNNFCFILSDNLVQDHTKLLLNDITKIIDKDKFNFMITKPISKSIFI